MRKQGRVMNALSCIKIVIDELRSIINDCFCDIDQLIAEKMR